MSSLHTPHFRAFFSGFNIKLIKARLHLGFHGFGNDLLSNQGTGRSQTTLRLGFSPSGWLPQRSHTDSSVVLNHVTLHLVRHNGLDIWSQFCRVYPLSLC